jgi:hypothetical protein
VATRNSASSERSSRSKDSSEQRGIPPYEVAEQPVWAGLPQWLATLTRRRAPLHLASQRDDACLDIVASEKRVAVGGFSMRNALNERCSAAVVPDAGNGLAARASF